MESTRTPDFDRLESYLKVLAYARRLELLFLLRTPKSLEEVRLSPGPSQGGSSPDRPISRQAIQNHLDQLISVGLVRSRIRQGRGERAVREYVVDHSRLFAVVEELRKVSTFEPQIPIDPKATEILGEGWEGSWEEGPKVLLVHGVHEGKVFPLRSRDLKPPRGWIIGRSERAHVVLEYDPYVSHENAEILRVGNSFRLLDLRTSKNGTYLNWKRLPVGGEAPLESGDVIGVGRSLLVFRST